jgi:hypothetical protein
MAVDATDERLHTGRVYAGRVYKGIVAGGRKVAGELAVLPLEIRARRAVLTELETLDPEIDDHRITQIVLGSMFSDAFFHQALFTVAYWRQVAVASIAPVIARRGVGDTLSNTRKRTDDTLLFFGFIYRDGYAAEPGTATIDRLSEIHKTFPEITMDDYRYTIATLCFEPVRIPEILGVRGLTAKEQRALFLFWTRVAERWGVRIPEGQAEFRAWFHDYERRSYRRSQDAVDVALAMEKAFLDRWAPGPLRPVGQQVLRAFSDAPLLDAVDMPPANPAMKKLVALAVDGYLRGRRIVPGPRTDMLCAPWAKHEYGAVPAPSEVGPAWAAGIQAPAPGSEEPVPQVEQSQAAASFRPSRRKVG